MELKKKIALVCAILQVVFHEVHPVPEGQMNGTTRGDLTASNAVAAVAQAAAGVGLGDDDDEEDGENGGDFDDEEDGGQHGSKGYPEDVAPTKLPGHTSTPLILASLPISVNFTSPDRNNLTNANAAGGAAVDGGVLGNNNDTDVGDAVGGGENTNFTDVDGTAQSGNGFTSSDGSDSNTTVIPHITNPNFGSRNVTGGEANDTGVGPFPVDDEETPLPVPVSPMPPDSRSAAISPGEEPSISNSSSGISDSSSSNDSSSSLPHPTQIPDSAGADGRPSSTLLAGIRINATSTLPPTLYERTTTGYDNDNDNNNGGLRYRSTTPPYIPPSTTTSRRGWHRFTLPPSPPPHRTTTVSTQTSTSIASPSTTHRHNLSPPRQPSGGFSEEGEETNGGRGEIAGMDPLALGIGICIPVLLIIVVILSVFCYRKYKKGGRGYITLDDFGTFEGMQNPNYDGEL